MIASGQAAVYVASRAEGGSEEEAVLYIALDVCKHNVKSNGLGGLVNHRRGRDPPPPFGMNTTITTHYKLKTNPRLEKTLHRIARTRGRLSTAFGACVWNLEGCKTKMARRERLKGVP